MDKRANLKIPRQLFDELQRLADERDTTAARLAKRAIREFIAAGDKGSGRTATLARGGSTDDEFNQERR